MREDMKLESDSSHAIDLDSKQREELDKLIESLKKEVVLPKSQPGQRIEIPELEQE